MDMFPFADILSRTGFNVFFGTTEWHVSTLYVCMDGWMDGWMDTIFCIGCFFVIKINVYDAFAH